MREYLIATPGYVHFCGGIKSLHKLAYELNQRGYTAYVTGDYCNPEFNTPMAKLLSQEKLRDLQHNGVIVYPDIVPNNPARFTHCVKYWLGASQPPPPNQLVFSFSEMHDVVHKNENHLFIWHIESFFEEPDIENRHTNCAYAGKGSGIDIKPVPEIGPANAYNGIPGCFRITAGNPNNRVVLAQLLQQSKVFYCYDNLTVLMTEARLCGTPVILMGHYVIPPDDFLNKDEFSQYGIGMYDDNPDIDKLKSEIPLFREVYKQRENKTKKEIERFIELTQEWNKDNIYVDDPGPYDHKIYGHKNFELWRTR